MKDTKILVVDDVEIVCLHLKEELEELGCLAECAYSGEEAVEKAKKDKFDIAFVDLMMPGMDGVKTCTELKNINPATEVILFSGHPTELELKKAAFLKAGGRDEFLRKPLIGGEVQQVIEKIVKEKKG